MFCLFADVDLVHADSDGIAQSVEDMVRQVRWIRWALKLAIWKMPFEGDVLEFLEDFDDFWGFGHLFA